MSECERELLFVSPGAGGSDPWRGWCFKTEDAVLFSSSSSSSEAEPRRESENKEKKTNVESHKLILGKMAKSAKTSLLDESSHKA